MTNTAQTLTKPSRNWALRQAGRVVDLVDQRITASNWVKRNAREAFPDHWSFWLGYIALFSLVVILLSGVLLALWFKPSMAAVAYDGTYAPLRGVVVSEAYASTLDLSFEVRGGLLMRQVHYWATHVFIAAMAVHLLRVFFTGAFRTPRKLNWLIGLGLLVLGIIGGYTGHGLPDDLLSGTGLRVVEGGMVAIPIVGTYLSSFIFGGEYPGEDIISRLYVLHVFLLTALIVALLTVHLIVVRRQRHTQWGGAGKTNRNIVGSPFVVHTTRAGGFMLIVIGFILLMAATLQINPVWLRGPFDPSQVGAGSQPDWYVGFLDGALRLMPPWAIDVFGHELTLSVLVPAIVLPGIILTALAIYPWIEQKITGEQGDQHILDRPRDMPARTGLGVGFIVFYVLLWIAGGNDILATVVDVPVNWVTRFLQISVILMPPLAYSITKRTASASNAVTATRCCTESKPASPSSGRAVDSPKCTSHSVGMTRTRSPRMSVRRRSSPGPRSTRTAFRRRGSAGRSSVPGCRRCTSATWWTNPRQRRSEPPTTIPGTRPPRPQVPVSERTLSNERWRSPARRTRSA